MTVRTAVFYAVDRPGAGRITSVFKGGDGSVAAQIQRMQQPALLLEPGEPDEAFLLLNEWYVDLTGPAPTLAACRPMQWWWDAATLSLRDLPQPCTLTLMRERHLVGDGEADLSDLLPGTYEVTIQAAGFRTQTCTVTR